MKLEELPSNKIRQIISYTPLHHESTYQEMHLKSPRHYNHLPDDDKAISITPKEPSVKIAEHTAEHVGASL